MLSYFNRVLTGLKQLSEIGFPIFECSSLRINLCIVMIMVSPRARITTEKNTCFLYILFWCFQLLALTRVQFCRFTLLALRDFVWLENKVMAIFNFEIGTSNVRIDRTLPILSCGEDGEKFEWGGDGREVDRHTNKVADRETVRERRKKERGWGRVSKNFTNLQFTWTIQQATFKVFLIQKLVTVIQTHMVPYQNDLEMYGIQSQ